MPRLSTKRYLDIHYQLIELYQTNHGIFAGLSSADQSALHTFFQTTRQRSDEDLICIREQLTHLEPSLPHQAGRAYKRLQEQLALFPQPSPPAPITKRASTRTRGERVVIVRSVQHPEPDFHALARAMVLMMRNSLDERPDN